MAKEPVIVLRKTEKLVSLRSVDTYKEIATLLADLREALAGTDQAGLAERHARKLKQAHPTLHFLTRELRSKGFVPK